MSLYFALEDYPLVKSLPDGSAVELRPMRESDLEAIKTFYPSIPEHERMFIKHPVTDLTILEDWCRDIDYERNLPLLALVGDSILAEGTLHFRNGGWKKHIGLISVLTHPEYRGIGLSELLVESLIDAARHSGLRKLEAEFNGERDTAIQSLNKAGFRELVRLPDYLEDMQANTHDYVLLGMDLITDEEFAGMG